VQGNWIGGDQADWQVLDLAGVDRAESTSARHWVAARLTALGEAHRGDTMMVVGELLENAYQHGGGPRQLRIRHRRDPCEVTVAVADAGAGVPRMRVPDLGGGRGLLLVDKLCLDWGVRSHDDGKVVWARLGCAGSESPCACAPRG
jgi:anti-sigma regulatory factor (Ser/Thr protein kinase)